MAFSMSHFSAPPSPPTGTAAVVGLVGLVVVVAVAVVVCPTPAVIDVIKAPVVVRAVVVLGVVVVVDVVVEVATENNGDVSGRQRPLTQPVVVPLAAVGQALQAAPTVSIGCPIKLPAGP